MKFLAVLVFVLTVNKPVKSQYYFNDIIAAQQSQKQYLALKNNNIKKVTAISYEGSNEPVDNFHLEQIISSDASTITIYSGDPSSGNTVTINRYENNKRVRTVDSSTNVTTTTYYMYDDQGRIKNVATQTIDTFMNSNSEEVHQWVYNDNKPSYMLRIKDKNDTTIINFVYDDKGNAGQENWVKKNRVVESYYYYYNDKGDLTDIVRYNNRAKKMLPDFLYEYDANDRIVQMMQIPAGSSDYMIWRYVYNGKGLKQKELLYNKQNQLIGKVEYQYQ